MKRKSAAEAGVAERTEEVGEPDIAELIEVIVRSRKELKQAQASAEDADSRVHELRVRVKESTARLMDAINGPRKPRAVSANGAGGPQGVCEVCAQIAIRVLLDFEKRFSRPRDRDPSRVRSLPTRNAVE